MEGWSSSLELFWLTTVEKEAHKQHRNCIVNLGAWNLF